LVISFGNCNVRRNSLFLNFLQGFPLKNVLYRQDVHLLGMLEWGLLAYASDSEWPHLSFSTSKFHEPIRKNKRGSILVVN
jgi:hypothetical protein